MTKIAIIGSGSEGLEIAKIVHRTAKDRGIEIVVLNTEQNNKPFETEPFKITAPLPLPKLTDCYDKKGKLFDLPKSKYHK